VQVRFAFFSLLLLGNIIGCNGSQPISLVTEDFRFMPDLVRVRIDRPLRISVFNAGREIHEFDSPIMQYATGPRGGGRSPVSGITLAPGQTVRLDVAPPAGTYLDICRWKGHANMTGTLIVE
jgi:hypothetical protein